MSTSSFDDRDRRSDAPMAIDMAVQEPMSQADSDELTGLSSTAGAELELDSSDIERVTLVELPAIARYGGKYELLGRIAYGGMAEIFLCREIGPLDSKEHETRRLMVVKRVLPHVAEDEHFVNMFIDEARLAMQLNHPNICHVYNFGQAEGTYYIAMEWVNGKPLSKIIRRARKADGIPLAVILKIIAQVAEALDYAHRATDAAGEPLGIVHRDVSPQNIMVSYDGVVKLLDFGIAKASSHSTRTEAGVIKGKFAYMSPQQCVGEPIDARADIFALGICLFEALAGKNPFRRKTEFETMTRIVGDPTPSVHDRREGVPPAIADVINTALMKQPELRYQTAGDMQLAIERVLPTLGVVMNASRIGEYVSELFGDDIRDGPQLDMRLSIPPSQAAVSSVEDSISDGNRPRPLPGSTELDAPSVSRDFDPSAPAASPPPEKRKRGFGMALFIVVQLMLVCAGSAIAWVTFGDRPVETIFVETPSPPAPSPPVVAPPPEPVVATTGSLFIESDPPGATIALSDRENAGTTPLEIGMIEPGNYDLRLTLEGHEDWSGQIVIQPGHRATITADLHRIRVRAPVGRPGQLSLNTRPWSKVYLGRRLLGTTPFGGAEVPSGAVRLRFVDRDGNEHRRTVRVPPGGQATESFDLR